MPDKLNLVLYWHMHQPEYRDLRNGEYHLPWTYLHSIKDYVDMVSHIEAVPDAKVVVNFAPVLLEQIDDYSQQLKQFLHMGSALRDPLLSALAEPVLPESHEQRMLLLKACLRANENRLIERFKPYKRLADMAKIVLADTDTLNYYCDQYLVDLIVWYHLAWLGETVRRKDTRIKALMDKAQMFSLHNRRLLVEIIYELMSGLIGRYKRLAEQGRVELSMTPYAHPIVPLLLDIDSASEAVADIRLPLSKQYPGGEERSRWHMQKGIETFQRFFGFAPRGCWPSEGSVSSDTLKLMSDMGIDWVCSGETVLRNSLAKSSVDDHRCLHKAYQLEHTSTRCFFRDDGLSDLIGFKYADWHADDAVANLIHNLENIASSCDHQDNAIVSIILDGENAWEYYPENGYYFLSTLYEQLAKHDAIQLTTYSEYLDRVSHSQSLSHLVAGSWVYGTFTTWIGDQDKNRAWDMLVDAKQLYDRKLASGQIEADLIPQAELQLAICEGSDWFWWFGDYNAAESVSAFDQQYRMHLCNLYHLLAEEPPEYLSHAFSHGNGGASPAMGGVMLPGQQH